MIYSHWLLLASAVFALVGCNGARQPQYASLGLIEVTGTVKLDGEPLADAMVAFENPEDKTFSFAKTNAAGGYRLMFNSEKSGCTPGKKIVRITPYREPDADPVEVVNDTKVPARYGRNSELKAEVDSDHRTFDFELQAK